MFNWFFYILAGNEGNHKISNGFKIRQDWTRDLWVSCPWAYNWRNVVTTLVHFEWIFLILADNKINCKSSDELEFWQDCITDYRVGCPWAYQKSMNNVVTTLAPSFLIGSSLFSQATRKLIISRMGSKFSMIWPGTYELLALERLENPYRPIMGEMLWPL